MDEMEAVIIKFSDGMLLPPAEGLCQQCGRDHTPDWPHDQRSLHYQYWFRINEGKSSREERWPTWRDAMAHCTPEVQEQWTTELNKLGVDIDVL